MGHLQRKAVLKGMKSNQFSSTGAPERERSTRTVKNQCRKRNSKLEKKTNQHLMTQNHVALE